MEDQKKMDIEREERVLSDMEYTYGTIKKSKQLQTELMAIELANPYYDENGRPGYQSDKNYIDKVMEFKKLNHDLSLRQVNDELDRAGERIALQRTKVSDLKGELDE